MKAVLADFRQYDMDTTYATSSGVVIRNPGVFAFMVTNLGQTPARVNGLLLNPPVTPGGVGDSRTISGQPGDLYGGKIEVIFEGALTDPNVEVVQLFYNLNN